MTPLIPSGRYWKTAQAQTFTLSDGMVITIPKGYTFDGHTVLFLGFFLNPFSYDMYAALLHDYLYEYRIGTRAQSDKEYLLKMQELGTNKIRRYTFYVAVRLFGWALWYT